MSSEDLTEKNIEMILRKNKAYIDYQSDRWRHPIPEKRFIFPDLCRTALR